MIIFGQFILIFGPSFELVEYKPLQHGLPGNKDHQSMQESDYKPVRHMSLNLIKITNWE